MKFYKYFSLTIICSLIIIFIYLSITFINKKHQEQQVELFYQQQHNIALQEAAFNQSLIAPKIIPKDQPVRILVLEGGGLKGIMSARVLDYIEKNSHDHISNLFDIIYGTSIGALTATFLAIPDEHGQPKYSAQDLIKFIKYDAKSALMVNNYSKFLTGFGLISPIINYNEYENILKYFLGNLQLSQLTTNVVVDAYDIKQKQIVFFSSRLDKVNNDNFLLYQLLLGATAIAGIMPPQKIYSISSKASYMLIDPGLVSNNPMLAALIYANKMYPDNKKIIVFIGLGYHMTTDKVGFNGIFGSLGEYSNMIRGGSRDKLLKLYIDELASSNKLGVQEDDVFYIDEPLSIQLGSPLDSSDENISILENVSESIIIEQKPALIKLIKKLKSGEKTKATTK